MENKDSAWINLIHHRDNSNFVREEKEKISPSSMQI